MIRYEQLDNKDVKVITDDSQAELAQIQESLETLEGEEPLETYKNVEACRQGEDGFFEFVIPRDEVGEVADLLWDVDSGALEEQIDEWNQQALAEADSQAGIDD
jgi:hypothetical protein